MFSVVLRIAFCNEQTTVAYSDFLSVHLFKQQHMTDFAVSSVFCIHRVCGYIPILCVCVCADDDIPSALVGRAPCTSTYHQFSLRRKNFVWKRILKDSQPSQCPMHTKAKWYSRRRPHSVAQPNHELWIKHELSFRAFSFSSQIHRKLLKFVRFSASLCLCKILHRRALTRWEAESKANVNYVFVFINILWCEKHMTGIRRDGFTP